MQGNARVSQVNVSTEGNPHVDKVKLPTLDLSKFNGNYSQLFRLLFYILLGYYLEIRFKP